MNLKKYFVILFTFSFLLISSVTTSEPSFIIQTYEVGPPGELIP